MKKIFSAIALLAVMATGVITLSAFMQPKNESSPMKDNCDEWKLYRSNVAYCSGVDEDKGVCAGTDGTVWLNTDNEQLVITLGQGSSKPCNLTSSAVFDLSYTTKYEGYNYRFYRKGQYYYINITVPRSRYY